MRKYARIGSFTIIWNDFGIEFSVKIEVGQPFAIPGFMKELLWDLVYVQRRYFRCLLGVQTMQLVMAAKRKFDPRSMFDRSYAYLRLAVNKVHRIEAKRKFHASKTTADKWTRLILPGEKHPVI